MDLLGLVCCEAQNCSYRNFRIKDSARVRKDRGCYLVLQYTLGWVGEDPHQDEEERPGVLQFRCQCRLGRASDIFVASVR